MSAIARPFGMLLMFLYELVGNYGLAIILFAVIVRAILLPFQMKSKRGTMQSMRLQPKLAELQKKHGANKQKLNEETAKLYKDEGINPASGCLWGFLPLPIMFALFLAIRQPITMMMGVAPELLEEGGAILNKLLSIPAWENYSTLTSYYVQIDQAQFITEHFSQFADLSASLRPMTFNFFGNINLGVVPNWKFLWDAGTNWSDVTNWLPGLILFLIPFLSGGSQLISSIISKKLNPTPATPDGQQGTAGAMQSMLYLMPLMSVYFAFITPSALGIYWTIGSILQIAQDIWLTKRYTRIIDAEDAVKNAERNKREAELEAKRLESERKKEEGIIEQNQNTSKQKKQRAEKQEKTMKAVEWQKKDAPPKGFEPSREGDRRFARGRAYDPDRFLHAGEGNDEGDDSEAADSEGFDGGEGTIGIAAAATAEYDAPVSDDAPDGIDDIDVTDNTDESDDITINDDIDDIAEIDDINEVDDADDSDDKDD